MRIPGIISEKFWYFMFKSKKTKKQLAEEAGIKPATLGRLLSGRAKIKPNDERIIKVGKIMGLEPEECFDKTLLTVMAAVEKDSRERKEKLKELMN